MGHGDFVPRKSLRDVLECSMNYWCYEGERGVPFPQPGTVTNTVCEYLGREVVPATNLRLPDLWPAQLQAQTGCTT